MGQHERRQALMFCRQFICVRQSFERTEYKNCYPLR